MIYISIKTIPKIYPFWAAWKKTSAAESAEALHSEDVQSFMCNLVFYAYYETFIAVPHINCVSLVESSHWGRLLEASSHYSGNLSWDRVMAPHYEPIMGY